MVNKLRITAAGSGAFLVAAAAWAAVEYGPRVDGGALVGVALLGVAVAAAPAGLARARLYYARVRTEAAGGRPTDDRYFVSADGVGNRDAALRAVREAVADREAFDDVATDDFPEGGGLRVTHTGFHNSFVRVADSGRVVVSGASERTADLSDAAADVLGVDFDHRWSNPMQRERPVTGGVRVVLATLLLVTAVGGGLAVADAAYPSDAYNPAEKAVLASYDARAAVSPSVSETDATIAKARFRVTALQEVDTEVAWTGNESRAIVARGHDALRIAADVRNALDALDRDALTPAQRRRVRDVRADLRRAEVSVADALAARADDAGISPDGAEDIRDVADALRNHRAGTGTLSLSITLPRPDDEGLFTTIDGNASARSRYASSS